MKNGHDCTGEFVRVLDLNANLWLVVGRSPNSQTCVLEHQACAMVEFSWVGTCSLPVIAVNARTVECEASSGQLDSFELHKCKLPFQIQIHLCTCVYCSKNVEWCGVEQDRCTTDRHDRAACHGLRQCRLHSFVEESHQCLAKSKCAFPCQWRAVCGALACKCRYLVGRFRHATHVQTARVACLLQIGSWGLNSATVALK